MSLLGRPRLFLSSYARCSALLAIRFEQRWLWISCVVLAALGVASLWAAAQAGRPPVFGAPLAGVGQGGRRGGGRPPGCVPASIPYRGYANGQGRPLLRGFLLVAAVINIRSVAQVNPLLYLLSYRVLSVTDDHGLSAYMIIRHSPPAGDRVLAIGLRDDVLVDRTSPGR
jgi:hypothetical protein